MAKPKIPTNKCESALERTVARWANSSGRDYDTGAKGALGDLFYGGCQSGIVSELIYYADTLKFYKRHREAINALLKRMQEDTGMSAEGLRNWDKTDPLALDSKNQNILAWYGFEETARILADRMGWEI